MPHTDTGMRARLADESGHATRRDGLRLYYEVFGGGPKTIVLMPCTPISHSRMWKGQIHYLARHFRLITYDGLGNGLSDHPDPSGPWSASTWANDCLTVWTPPARGRRSSSVNAQTACGRRSSSLPRTRIASWASSPSRRESRA